MIPWIYIIAGFLSLALLVFLLRKEVRRPGRSRLGWRVAASVLAVAGLAGLILPLTYHRAVAAKAPLAAMHSEPKVTGLVAVDWQRRLLKGERLQVQGHWQRADEGQRARDEQGRPVRLRLLGLGGVLDSAVAGARGDFSLSTVPAQEGRAVYRIVAVAGSDTMEQENIPVEVDAGRVLKILILAATPDFENTFLVNWLAKNGQQVASRTAVSRNDYQSSFVNMEPRPLSPLGSSLLGGFDLVIADASVLPSLGEAGLTALRRQVEEKGLGLIIKVDSTVPAGVSIGGKEGPRMRSLVRDSFSRTAVSGRLYGLGKVAFTTMNTTYARMLSGQAASYAAYWSMLLGRVAPEVGAGEEWHWEPALPRVREPVVLGVQTGGGQPQGMIGSEAGSVAMYLAQDKDLSFLYKGVYWPEAEGWVALHTLQGDTTWMYVWPRGAWASLYRGIEAPGPQAVRGGWEEVAVPRYVFYIAFLISILFLWVERKMGGMSGQIIQ